MKSKFFITVFILIFTFVSCEVKPKKINYGNDHCLYCDMTVVDRSHASQYVTLKGRSYAFDAIECLVHQIIKNDNENELAFILVVDYGNPGNLVDAKTATYLISEKIKSPMGENLSAFSEIETAKKAQSMHGGKIYTWSELKSKLSR